MRAIHLLECACRGNLDRAILYERLPEAIEAPEEALFAYVRGRKYVFFVESVKWERGQVIGFMADGRSPQPVEDIDGGSTGPVAGPSGPANHFKCYGCSAGGSVYDYVMKRDGCDFAGAKAKLESQLGIAPGLPITATTRRTKPAPLLVPVPDKCGTIPSLACELWNEGVDYFQRSEASIAIPGFT